ncbi:MAG: hypothetical protein ACPGU1_13235, partial [Myxococcota bacterium]
MKFWTLAMTFALVGCGVSTDSDTGIPVVGAGAYTVGDTNPQGPSDATEGDDLAEGPETSPEDVSAPIDVARPEEVTPDPLEDVI